MTGRRTTLGDLAAQLGLSVNTVSRALAGKDGVSERTRALVLDGVQDPGNLGTLARSAAAFLTGLVAAGVVLPVSAGIIWNRSEMRTDVLLSPFDSARRSAEEHACSMAVIVIRVETPLF
jgi:hypothetical protein